MHKNYYPMRPAKGKLYRKPRNVIYVYIDADLEGNYKNAAASDGIDDLIYFEYPIELANFITSLPNNTWVITYDIDNWSSVFTALINTFDHITGIGKNNHVLELTFGDNGYTVIDAYQYTACSLPDAIERLTGHAYYHEMTTVEICFLLSIVWGIIVDVMKVQFNCYPSKTPGATAIKVWRRFLPEDIHAEGQHTNRITRAAIRQPALHWRPGIYDNAYMYDISASYPSVMSNIRYPIRLRTFIDRPPPSNRWIATVKINYKCRGEFSPIAIPLHDGTHVCPVEIKNHRVTITYIDAMSLEITGDFEIVEWIEGVYWYAEDERDLFSDWAHAIEAASQEPRAKQVLKIVSRSLHSKFAQRPYYIHVEIYRADPSVIKQLVKSSGKVLDIYPLDDGELAIKHATRHRTGFKPFDRPDWEALTMAAARFRMYASIDSNTIYTHTDCIISTEPRTDLDIGAEFGRWKYKQNGITYIAGIGLYAIGAEVGKSGMRVNDDTAREAISRAVENEVQIINTVYHPNLFSPIQAGKSRFTVKAQNYPHAVVNGNRAWVTRSPTRLIMVKSIKRRISSGGRERCLKL